MLSEQVSKQDKKFKETEFFQNFNFFSKFKDEVNQAKSGMKKG
jgi:hypothetical protein